MITERKSNVVKVRPSSGANQDASSSANKKKVVGSSTKKPLTSDSRHKSSTTTTTVTKTEVKAKATPSSLKAKTKTTTVKTRVKKAFSLPGQKYDPPEEREPLRIFYESLSKQIPSSEMAEFWMMEHGLLSPDKSKKAFEKKQRKQKQLRTGIPIKSPPRPTPSSKAESSKKSPALANGDVKAKKRIINDSDDDFVLSPKRRK